MPTPRPIFYVHHERAIGGAPLSLLYLLRRLDRAKWTPRVICLRDGPAADLYRKEGLPVRVVPGPDLSHTELVWFRWWQFPRFLVRLAASIPLYFRLKHAMQEMVAPSVEGGAKERQPVVPPSATPPLSSAPSSFSLQPSALPLVHLNSSTLAVAAAAAKSLRLPVVWHIREPLAKGYFGVRRALLRAAIRRWSDAVIAICQNDAEQLGKMPGRRVRVIHNFVDFTQFDAARPKGALRKELGIPDDAPIVLYLGGDAETKGAGVLMDAASTILSRAGDAHLVVAGETSPGFTAAWIHRVAAGLRRRVHLLGVRMDVPSLLADADLLLFPSTVPHFARPVIEAAAMGVPSIASDLGGVRELVRPGETGALVRPSDPEALAEVTVALLADPAHRRSLGRAARDLARERFNAERNAAETVAVYEETLARSGTF